jgi:hypothetical protein
MARGHCVYGPFFCPVEWLLNGEIEIVREIEIGVLLNLQPN